MTITTNTSEQKVLEKTTITPEQRRLLVQLFYRYMLLENNPELISKTLREDVENLLNEKTSKKNPNHDDNAKLISETTNLGKQIADSLPQIIERIATLLAESWDWSRLSALVQAILIIGTYEIVDTDNPKAITIDSMVELAKVYGLEENYKFINALLDKIKVE